MRRNVEKVWACFVARRACVGDSTRSISTDGTAIFSYGDPIARRGVDGNVYHLSPSEGKHTRTTMSQLRSLLVIGRGHCTDEAGLRSVAEGEIPPMRFCSGFYEAAAMIHRITGKQSKLLARTRAALHDRLMQKIWKRLEHATHPKERAALETQLVQLDAEEEARRPIPTARRNADFHALEDLSGVRRRR